MRYVYISLYYKQTKNKNTDFVTEFQTFETDKFTIFDSRLVLRRFHFSIEYILKFVYQNQSLFSFVSNNNFDLLSSQSKLI
jgi:hypothetical protein